MTEKEYKRSKLLELLKTEPMTSKELADKLNIPINQIFTYLAQYSKDGKVVKCGKKGKFNLYSAVESNPIELLKFLNDFFKENLDYLMKNKNIDKFIEKNEAIFNKIEELVK